MTDRLHHAIDHAQREMERQPDGPVMVVRAHLQVLVDHARAAIRESSALVPHHPV
jgi:hypothetical protein